MGAPTTMLPHGRIPGVLPIVILFAVATFPRSVSAAPVFETYGSPNSSNPFNARVLPSGADATYFNPALLVDLEPEAFIGSFLASESLSVRLEPRPADVDVSQDIYNARVENSNGISDPLSLRPLPTRTLRARGASRPSQTNHYLTMGASIHLVPKRIAFGVSALIPTRSFQSQLAAYVDEREQYFSNSLHFELFGDRMQTNLISFAAAVRPLDWLSIGAGVTLATEGRASNKVFLPDASNQDATYMNTGVEVKTKFRPHLGIDLNPFSCFHAVATFHAPYANDTVGTNDLQLWNFEYPSGKSSFQQDFVYQSHTVPMRAAVGAGWRPKFASPVSWSAAGTVTWTQWSQYRDRHREAPANPWLDTFSLALGASARWRDHRVGLDTTYVPSPVPPQNGRSNYVDNDRAGLAIGYGFSFKILDLPMRLGLSLQVQRLLPRSVSKSSQAKAPVVDEFPNAIDARTGSPIPSSAGLQTNNPGYPGFASEGWLLGGGIHATVFL